MAEVQDLRSKALSKLRKKRALKKQGFSYIAVNAGLILIWLINGMGYFWPIWPIVWWGLSLLIQAWKLTHPERGFSDDEIEAEMRQLN